MSKRRFITTLFLLLAGCSILFSFSSCSSSRKVMKSPLKEEGADYLFKKLKENELRYDWFTAKFSAEYKNNRNKTSFNGQIRIRKDSLIWLSFSPMLNIEAFRVTITQDSVKYMNRMNDTYFAGDYNVVNRLLGTNVDFDLLQSFLTGNDLSFYENGKFKASVDKNVYKLSTAERRKLKKYIRKSEEDLNVLIQNIWINPENFKIIQADVKEIREPNIRLNADYNEFEKIGEQLFPKEMIFDIFAANNIHVKIDFSRISVDVPQAFPFRIPDSYRQVK
ncbi:MAG: DUF4292 domain-containing protein [Bacteroidota bacterium]|nr:DUF4292 domain-containing protein [Bacteroidota bacterium]